MRAVLGFLVLLANASAQTPLPKARIEGRLQNGLTGEPLRKGILRLHIAGSLSRGPEYLTESDANGNFVFEQVEPGPYVLSAERAGFLRGNYGAKFLANGEPIRLRGGESRSVRVDLTPRSAISGQVLDADGDPLPDIEVEVWRWRWSPQAGQRMLQLTGRATPDENGNFRMASLETGQYYLSASSLGVRDVMPGGRVIRRGPVVQNTSEGYQTTFYPGVLSVADAKSIPIAAGQEVHGVNLRLQKGKLVQVRGTVVNHYSFRPLNPMTVELIPMDQPPQTFPAGTRSVSVQDGSFDFNGVAPGRYSLMARDNSPSEHLVARTEVVVNEGDVDHVRLELRAGADIKCAIRMDGTRTDVHDHPEGAWLGAPVNATVMLRSAEGGPLNTVAAARDVTGGPSLLRDVPPGRYWVDVINLPSDVFVKWIRSGQQDVTTAPLKVGKDGSEPPIEVILSNRTATLSGVVVEENGNAARIAQVMLAPAARELERVSRLVRGVVTGPGGTFRFEGVAPGQYVVLAFEDAEPGLAEDPEFRAGFAQLATPVNLAASGHLSIEVRGIRTASK